MVSCWFTLLMLPLLDICAQNSPCILLWSFQDGKNNFRHLRVRHVGGSDESGSGSGHFWHWRAPKKFCSSKNGSGNFYCHVHWFICHWLGQDDWTGKVIQEKPLVIVLLCSSGWEMALTGQRPLLKDSWFHNNDHVGGVNCWSSKCNVILNIVLTSK